jgi:hypothetical protein
VLTARMTLSECVRAALAAALLLGLAACATPGDRAASPASPAMNVLAGLDSAQVRALLGTPDFRRSNRAISWMPVGEVTLISVR